MSIWQATSQGQIHQTHGGTAGETEKITSSFSPESYCCAYKGTKLENKILPEPLPEPCALHILAAGHLGCAELGWLVILRGSGGSVLLPRQDRRLSGMQPQGIKKRLLEGCTAVEHKAECTGSSKTNKKKNLKKRSFPRGYSYVRKGQTEQPPSFWDNSKLNQSHTISSKFLLS